MTDLDHPGPRPAPTAPSRTARRGVVLPLGVAAVAAGAGALLVVRSPYTSLSYGICPSVLFLGVACPGCGGLRATHDLLTGDVVGALAANPVWTVAAPLLVLLWVRWTVGRLRGWPPVTTPAWVPWAVLVVVAAFAVLRNVPVLTPWLGPAPSP